jgi:hypothetical protein
MLAAGLWLPRAARKAVPHQPRNRRECFGELVQIDGSKHRWFEERGPECTLLVYVDDATSKLMELRFVVTVASGLGEIHFQQHQRDPGIHLLISKQFFA